MRVYERVRRKVWRTTAAQNLVGMPPGEPTYEELAEELGIRNEKIARLTTMGLRLVSLDAPISDEEQSALCENIPDDQSLTPFEFLSEKDFSEQINR
jgi:DNA-directed RNA polymerase sigma subunit (sigma70/sigma32)